MSFRSSRMKSRGRHLRQPLYSEQCSQPFEHDGGTSVLTDGKKKNRSEHDIGSVFLHYRRPFVIQSAYDDQFPRSKHVKCLAQEQIAGLQCQTLSSNPYLDLNLQPLNEQPTYYIIYRKIDRRTDSQTDGYRRTDRRTDGWIQTDRHLIQR